MSALNRSHRKKLANFQAVTGAPLKFAADFLKRNSWSLGQVVDIFFPQGHSYQQTKASDAVDSKKIDTFFQKYKAPDHDSVRPDGIQELCNDLGISALDPVTLVISYHCRADRMGVFTREEFVGGMQRIGIDDVQQLRAKLDGLRAMLADHTTCKEIYGFTFQFALDQGQKCLPVDMCVEFWKLLMRGSFHGCAWNHFVQLDAWLSFVEQRVKKSISKDTWMMFYDLATHVKPDLSDYDMKGAWPVLLDEFVEQMRLSGAVKNTISHQLDS